MGKYRISRIERPDSLEPLFKRHLQEMRQFLDISDPDAWQKKALENLQQRVLKREQDIFVIKETEKIVGFAVVDRHLRFNEKGFAVAEFQIDHLLRHNGLGRKLAGHLFKTFPGNWEVAVARKNIPARNFWEKVVTEVTNEDYQVKIGNRFDGFGFLFNTGE